MALELPLTWLLGVLLAAARVGGWMVLAPPFNHRAIPYRVKALLSVCLAMSVGPRAPSSLLTGTDSTASTVSLMIAVATEFFIGAALGFLVMCIFAAVQAAGDIIDMLGGFTMAFAYDPLSNTGSAVMGRFYQITALTILFVTNAHLVVLGGLLKTYSVLPVGSMLDLGVLSRNATTVASGMLLAALQIAAPIVAILFLTDVGLGLLTRVAPSLNVFALGFSLKILVTLVAIGLSVATLPSVIGTMTHDATSVISRVVGK